ncbi:MAG: AgmX/PglI C-terminal domain-containing protein [Deltaproteobacteria bacterium]|nr:AgmX/PglI C-terminal domain-containing protein [Deltaproteobacteria bacterium]
MTRQAKQSRRSGDRAVLGALLLVFAACASTPPPKPAAPTAPPPSRHQAVDPLASTGDDGDDQMQVSGLLGQLSDSEIQRGLHPLLPKARACYDAQAKTQPFISGQLTLSFSVAQDGQSESVFVVQSTLGSAAVERCVRDELASARFSSPRGGKAIFQYPLRFDGRFSVENWQPAMVRQELTAARAKLFSGEPPSGLVITLYVDRRGRMVSAGAAAEAALDDDAADALLAALKRIRFVGAHGRYAKVTYPW